MSISESFNLLINPTSPLQTAESILVLLFAIAFLVVGVLRTVEFKGIGLEERTRRLLIALHLCGCILFTLALVLGVMNVFQDQRKIMFGLFVGSMLFLAPGQFMIGVRRRR